MKIKIKNTKEKFDMEVDGINREFWLWIEGLDKGRFFFEKREDKEWYESLSIEDVLKIKKAINQLT